MQERRGSTAGLLAGGAALGVVMATLLRSKPAAAAPSNEKFDYLVELLAAQIENQIVLNEAIQLWLTAQGVEVETDKELSILSAWIAKEPETIFDQIIREANTFNCDKMIQWTNGKRILFKIESSLDQAIQIQLVGNIEDAWPLSSNINGLIPCVANGNISIGPAWDDWHPFISARITAGVAPTTGKLNIRAVVQE